MTEREKILGRIREALSAVVPWPASSAGTLAQPARQWMPIAGETPEEQLELFQQKAAELKAAFHLLSGPEQLAESLRQLRQAEGWNRAGLHRGRLTALAQAALDLPICWTDAAYAPRELESCEVGITECDALIAQTGSVLVTSGSAGGRALSALPPHHVVLANREQLVGDLADAFALLKHKYAAAWPSMISLITGPSRTGDIERILVLGAHGPKKLTILCW